MLKSDWKKTAFLRSENAVFFQENEELVVLRLRFSSQKTSFSSEKTAFFVHEALFRFSKDVVSV